MSEIKKKEALVRDAIYKEAGVEFYALDNPFVTMFASSTPMRFDDGPAAMEVMKVVYNHFSRMIEKHSIKSWDGTSAEAANFYMGQLFHDNDGKLLVLALNIPKQAMNLTDEALTEIAAGFGKIAAPAFAAMKKDLLKGNGIPRDALEFIKSYISLTDKPKFPPGRN